MAIQKSTVDSTMARRWFLVLGFAALAFFASYRYAVAQNGASISATGAPAAAVASSGCGGACCGGGAAGPKVTKAAEVAGDVQKISVDLSTGTYNPNTIELKAGVPAEITFGQGGGCLAQVQSQDLNFFEDLTGGPKTIALGALEAGTYTFTCGMQMVSGTIVVK